MSESYIVLGLISGNCREQDITDVIISSIVDREYKLSTGPGTDPVSVDSKENLLSIANIDEGVVYGKAIDGNWFDSFYKKPDKIGSETEHWHVSLPHSNSALFYSSKKYLDEIEGVVHDLCSRLPVLLLYGTSSFEAEARPEFVNSNIEHVSSISYFSNKIIKSSIRERLIDAPVYSATEINDGLYVRLGKTLSSISPDEQETIADMTGLNVSR
ncbi:MAG: hypothetical protein ABEI13_02530 [Candidatus Paceibacteria bacterium]